MYESAKELSEKDFDILLSRLFVAAIPGTIKPESTFFNSRINSACSMERRLRNIIYYVK